jgi:hypothetical protein
VFTNSAGEFFFRAKHPEHYAVAVLTDQFLLPGRWQVVSAPASVVASSEKDARPIQVVLRPADSAP